MIADCVNCVSTPGWYGEKMFYCGGKCMSEYDTSKVCSTGSLVAKNLGQCSTPCYQAGPPERGGGCADNFDCGSNQICQIQNGRGMCIQAPPTVAPTMPPPTALNESYTSDNFNSNFYHAGFKASGLYIGVL